MSMSQRCGRMVTSIVSLGLAVVLPWLAGCDSRPTSGRGFRLPTGDAEKGRAAFVALQCHTCHTVAGLALPVPASKSPIEVVLGGEVMRVRTYGDLVTSIINPSHVLSERYQKELEGKLSPMPEFNENMTVAQMIDLVTFLQPHYKKLEVDFVPMQ